MSKVVTSSPRQSYSPPAANFAQPDAILCSTPDIVLWGYIAVNLPPALKIKSGQVVATEALSHQGLTTSRTPEQFFGAYGIPAQEVLPDATAVFTQVQRPKEQAFIFLPGLSTLKGRSLGIRLKFACWMSSSVCPME